MDDGSSETCLDWLNNMNLKNIVWFIKDINTNCNKCGTMIKFLTLSFYTVEFHEKMKMQFTVYIYLH